MQAATASLGGSFVARLPEPLGPQSCASSSQHPQRSSNANATSLSTSLFNKSSGVSHFSPRERKLEQAKEDTACLRKAKGRGVIAAASSSGKGDSRAGRQENPFEGKPAKVNGAAKGNGPDSKKKKDEVKPLPSALQAEVDQQWTQSFPTYMQSREEFESTGHWPAKLQSAGKPVYDGEAALRAAQLAAAALNGQGGGKLDSGAPPWSAALPYHAGVRQPDLMTHDPLWAAIRAEAKVESEREPLLSSFLYASILAHSCFERSLGFILANRLNNAVFLATQLMDIFDDVLAHDKQIQEAIRADVQAIRDRDPSCHTYSCALLYFKGYHALQAYRIAHALWNRGQKVLALNMQSRISEVFAVDIHPAARIGKAILMDHGTGVVIGETAVVGDRVSLLQGVTLGGTGKDCGDRHPKIADGCLIGAGATILGNIKVGKGAMVAAGSLVLKDVPSKSMVAGTPARIIGESPAKVPALTMDHNVAFDFCKDWEDAVRRQHEMELNNGSGI
ncbi:serine acetyltransferase [Klebsormidium nitens]|uniref:serine O-acetyltransferase n=1 Tax=Klebsormidium nitens TaxID=105231 RepID=A0A1Y1I107_KLENI|nr:serine acetyltransferase [Klebsormidium nitens]|eukprot:GAQ83139.1 serine acetyltransferase [Klebsormidium nitens]